MAGKNAKNVENQGKVRRAREKRRGYVSDDSSRPNPTNPTRYPATELLRHMPHSKMADNYAKLDIPAVECVFTYQMGIDLKTGSWFPGFLPAIKKGVAIALRTHSSGRT